MNEAIMNRTGYKDGGARTRRFNRANDAGSDGKITAGQTPNAADRTPHCLPLIIVSALLVAAPLAFAHHTDGSDHTRIAAADTNETAHYLPSIVVTAPLATSGLETNFDPKAPQQPLPANDGASFLRSIPGMNLIRKGGTDGDLVFRGMAASRLNILFDGEQILGGCGGRMDPPTAYIFPDSFDNVKLIKGPQSVRYGHGSSAGTALFERKPTYFLEPGGEASAAVTAASFNRLDYFLDTKAGTPLGYARGIVTYSKSHDYKDGDGENVHSEYERQSASVILGWTPNLNTRLELSAVKSDAVAAYADRGMDGSLFKRENYALKLEQSALGAAFDKLEANAYYNYIDHVMDNYTLRDGAAMDMASNPDRKTIGGRIAATLIPDSNLKAVIGAEAQYNRHTGRSSFGMSGRAYEELSRKKDAQFTDYGVFAETTWSVTDANRLAFGLRGDLWEAKDFRETISVGSSMTAATRSNPTADKTRRETLFSGFARYECDMSGGAAYIGLGYVQRAPDFWEVMNKESKGQDMAVSLSAFDAIEPEKTTQLDLGLTYNYDNLEGFVSAFYSKIDDFVLIQSQYQKPASMSATRNATIARNIDATTYGGEAGLAYRFSGGFKASASAAYTRGENDTDSHALAQIPPLEGRLGLDWDNESWVIGALARFVASQNRYSLNEGNIVGQDLGKGKAFNIFSINGGYHWDKTASVIFGIDNVFDKTYAEFISRSSASVEGYEQTIRVNEPGRTFWVKAQFSL
jgi:iron complex outermembrane receptor protein